MGFFFFFQAEDGIRDGHVTGVQTCALPISWNAVRIFVGSGISGSIAGDRPHGALSEIGMILMRATLSSWRALASRLPLVSTGIESGPPTVAIGTIGTPVLIASLMKPVRPARIALSRLTHGRSESTSPPGQ